MINLKRFKQSLYYAFSGLKKNFKEEQNFKIHTVAAILALILAAILQVAMWQFIILLIVITMVLAMEIISSIVERLVDLLKPRIHSYVKDIKDMAATLVFLVSLCALLIGILIFLPAIINKFFP